MTKFQGPAGEAETIKLEGLPNKDPMKQVWIITSPGHTPGWDQYVMLVMDIRPREGYPPAHLQFEGATHELLVAAIDPSYRRFSAHSARTHFINGYHIPMLRPINVVPQFEATDEEMEAVGNLCAKAICDGDLVPEPPFSVEGLREVWLTSITKTLAHMRGEEHAP